MQSSFSAGIDLPYVEGLRLDEALHPLTILATGLYGKQIPNQNGAPIRLIVPWKYGFKSIKSIVRINLTDHQPPITWNIAAPSRIRLLLERQPECKSSALVAGDGKPYRRIHAARNFDVQRLRRRSGGFI